MEIGEREREELAVLKDLPAFQLLMRLLADFEDVMLGEMASASEPADLLRITRFWQNLRTMRLFLTSRPEQAWNELQTLKENNLAMIDPAFLPQDLINRLRFGEGVAS